MQNKKQIIEKVAVELARQLVLSDIKKFLNDYDIETPLRKRKMPITTYVKDRLVTVSDVDLEKMAVRLGIDTSTIKRTHPTLFISYSWTNPEHVEWVRHLGIKLRANGVNAMLDIWDLRIGHDKNVFMELIDDPAVEKVLMIVNKDYAEKADARKGGVGTETEIILRTFHTDKGQDKFAAIVLKKDKNGKPYLPDYYGDRVYIDFTDPDEFDDKFNDLRLWCFDKTLHERPPLGEVIEPPAIQALWTEREICRAAVKTYFSLKDMPVDSVDNGDFKGFKSAAGYIYTCKIKDNIAVLQWTNETGEVMNSEATSFELDDNTLVVTDNIMGVTETFVKD